MSEERQRGVDLFNEVWRLMESREDDDRMLHAAHASRFHWGQAEECAPENLARGEWQISRVYVGARPRRARDLACAPLPRALRGERDRQLGSRVRLRGAGPRAHALAGHDAADEWKTKARAAGNEIADPEEREHFDEDYATLP